MKAAFQGEKGAFSEIACKKYFGSAVDVFPCFSFEDTFINLKKGKVDYAVLPIENSLYGSVYETYDLLIKYSYPIVGELYLQINHNLVAPDKLEIKNIKKIFSHPQALGQCSKFLKTLKKAEILPSYDTAGSAKMASEKNDGTTAAIASSEAAHLYKLKVLKKGIQNNKENYTRFVVISKKENSGVVSNPKSSICFQLKSIPGALFKALSVFALREIDLVKIESRPIPHKPFEYLFYIDLLGTTKEKKLTLALTHLEEITDSIITLGNYKRGKTFSS
ncbi:MAG: prephenate dehydratase [Ignavibacteriaceae bacterium]|nr:prephenate dehydratase [Ignavibacteriaceae bacterium]